MKHPITILLLSCSILFIVTSFSCTKENLNEDCQDPYEQKIDPINTELHNYFFDTGSYWVYEDTLTHQIIDSVFVIEWSYNYIRVQHHTQCYPSYIGEKYEINKESSLNGLYTELFQDQYISTIGNTGSLFILSNTLPVPPILIGGTVYSDLIEFESWGNFSPSNQKYVRYYYKPLIGVVRRVHYNYYVDTITYDLINYNVSLFQPVPFKPN